MSTSYERTERAEILKECLASIAGNAFRSNTKEGNKLSSEIMTIANNIFLPIYDNDEALDLIEKKYHFYQNEVKNLSSYK